MLGAQVDQGQLDLLDRIVRYASPFLAAGLASTLTYFTVGRQKRMDVLTTERLAAFKCVQTALVSLQHFCEASVGDLHGGDFSPRLEGLPPDVARSALAQGDALRVVLDRTRIFFPKETRKELDHLIEHVYLLASMELAAATEPSVARTEPYSRVIDLVQRCIERLYGDLRLPS